MTAVEIKAVQKSYDGHEVIHGVNCRVEEGEFVVLVGPSGCGKSTLLRMIAGLESITSGTISIGGRVVNDVAPKARDIAMVFQNYALYPHMTVRENMAFSLKLRGTPKSVIDAEVSRAAEILALQKLLDRFPRQLSGGQRQRTAMGRALVRNPRVFLFDEPLSNLDAKLRVSMRAEIKKLHQRLRVTTIYVTHDQIEAMTMADKIVVMHDGIVEQIGSPLELYDKPQNIFVASFIGSPAMNFIAGEVAENGDTLKAVFADGQEIELPETTECRTGQHVLCGIRPEHLSLADEGIRMSVDLVEPTGSETLVFAKFGEQEIVLTSKDRQKRNHGEPISVRVSRQHVHVFDPATGARI